MKRVTLVLALAALSVPAAAGATQTRSHSSSPSKASASHLKVYGTVSAITSATVTVKSSAKSRTFLRRAVSLNGIRVGSRVEAEGALRNGVLRLSSIHLDDRAPQSVSSAKSSDDKPGDDRGGQTAGSTPSADDQPGADRGGDNHGGDDRGDDQGGDDNGGDDNGGRHSGVDDGPGHH